MSWHKVIPAELTVKYNAALEVLLVGETHFSAIWQLKAGVPWCSEPVGPAGYFCRRSRGAQFIKKSALRQNDNDKTEAPRFGTRSPAVIPRRRGRASTSPMMPSRGNFQYFFLQSVNVNDGYSCALEGLPARVGNERLWLQNADIYGSDRTSETSNSFNTWETSAQAFGTRLHSRIKRHARRKNCLQTIFGHPVLLS